MDSTELLDHGYAWTALRIAAVSPDGLGAPTPCGRWDLRELLDHTVTTLAMFTDAVAGGPGPSPVGSLPWDRTLAGLAARSRQAWKAPGVMDRTFATSIGPLPGPVMASATLLETVVHGWDISQATGEAAVIPDSLAAPVLAFARRAIAEGDRGDHFAAALDLGDSPSQQLVAHLGRKPL